MKKKKATAVTESVKSALKDLGTVQDVSKTMNAFNKLQENKKPTVWERWSADCEVQGICDCPHQTLLCYHPKGEDECLKEYCPTWKNRNRKRNKK